MNLYDTEEYKGYKIEIWYDEDPENPRTDWDPISTMVCWHSMYYLGDSESWKGMDGKCHSQQLSKNYSEPIDLLYELAGLDREDCEDEDGNDLSFEDLYTKIEERGTIISPLYLYDHSGITISMGSFLCPWDSDLVGWIYMTKDKIAENWGTDKEAYEKAIKCMEGEVETYDDYLTGNVYGFSVVKEDEEDVLYSCGGFYGDLEESGLLEEAKRTIEYYLEQTPLEA